MHHRLNIFDNLSLLVQPASDNVVRNNALTLYIHVLMVFPIKIGTKTRDSPLYILRCHRL